MRPAKIIAANWKLQKTLPDVASYFKEFKCEGVPAVFFVSPVLLSQVAAATADTDIEAGAQNISEHESGAFTGETSAEQVVSAKAKWILIGHSERRQHFHETNELTRTKLQLAIKHNLKPMLCVGESLEQRESNQTMDVVKEQLQVALEGLKPKDLVIAYEPVWAIGTGKVATVEQASEVHAGIKGILSQLGLTDVKVLYGGSVKSGNATELMGDKNIDGVLVGGASLDASEFSKIGNAAREILMDS